MARPRKYTTEAARQAAFRSSREGQADRLRGLLFDLERAVWAASDAGDPLAERVKATTPEAMLERLTEAFTERAGARQETAKSRGEG